VLLAVLLPTAEAGTGALLQLLLMLLLLLSLWQEFAGGSVLLLLLRVHLSQQQQQQQHWVGCQSGLPAAVQLRGVWHLHVRVADMRQPEQRRSAACACTTAGKR
jgi:hypothetical protein